MSETGQPESRRDQLRPEAPAIGVNERAVTRREAMSDPIFTEEFVPTTPEEREGGGESKLIKVPDSRTLTEDTECWGDTATSLARAGMPLFPVLLFVELLSRAGTNLNFPISITAMAERTGRARTQAFKALRDLKAAGIVASLPPQLPGGTRQYIFTRFDVAITRARIHWLKRVKVGKAE